MWLICFKREGLTLSESEKRSNRFRYRLAFPQAVIVVLALMLAGRASAFTQIFPPFTGATDFITDFPTCIDSSDLNETVGPLGLLFDGAHFFVDDACNETTYRFTAAGGSALSPPISGSRMACSRV